MNRRFLLAHGIPLATAIWVGTGIAVVLVRQVDVALDALVGGSERTISAANALCLILAATLPGVARSQMRTWELLTLRSGLRIRKTFLAACVLLAAPALVWFAHALVFTNKSGWNHALDNSVCLTSFAMILTAVGLVAAAAPIVLAGFLSCLVVVQHWPASAGLLSIVIASADHRPNLALTTALSGLAIATYAASPQRVSLNFAGRPSLRALVASSKLSVRIRR